ncbi:MAG: type II toxin-antitoxin system RelE/ParE family toxin [Chryseobacterium sp.]|nr:type II toxin-antitoxin system RelE/ParE family toxin [Chryseobacterium sp.]
MMQKVVWSDNAKESLADIYDYIFENSPQNAEHVIDTLLELGNSLEDSRFDYSKDLIIDNDRFRFIPKWSYKIIYERKNNEVRIIDVFGTKQNPEILKKYK